MSSFCYKDTIEKIKTKILSCDAPASVDLDASSNDACQWGILKHTLDTTLINMIESKIRASFPWVPYATMTSLLKIMRT